MPSQANITIKKNDGTTDIVWTAISPSAGAGVPAIWKSLTVGTADNHRPEMRFTIANSKDGKSSKGRVTFAYPSILTDTTTGATSVVDNVRGFADFELPRGMPDSAIDEAVSQFINLLTTVKLGLKARASFT